MIRLLAALALCLLVVPAAAQDRPPETIVAGLSQNRVSITADFDGSEIIVYGAVRRESRPPEGRLDVDLGIRQFIVGTGGAPLTQPLRRVANSEVTHSTFGVLRLTLDASSYRWEFLAQGGGVLDSGAGVCHGTAE